MSRSLEIEIIGGHARQSRTKSPAIKKKDDQAIMQGFAEMHVKWIKANSTAAAMVAADRKFHISIKETP
jgi:hypothetical protein